jgi:surface carbohydrate biosynthesis protein
MSRRRISLRFPRKRTVALIDSSGLSLISRFIPEDAVNVVDIESPNIFVILRMLILRMKSMHGYNIAFIKATQPSFVFTFIDNNVDFYRLAKRFPNVKFIAIQNGHRANYANQSGHGFFELLEKASKETELASHTMCVLGKSSEAQYSKYIRSNVVVIGSMKNNLFTPSLNANKKYDVVYISQHAPYDIESSDSRFFFGRDSIPAVDFYRIEELIVAFLAKWCASTGNTFAVLGKRTADQTYEVKFFERAAESGTVTYIPRTSDFSTYEHCASASLIVTADSTTGYEFLARGSRVVFLSARIHAARTPSLLNRHDTDFGHPMNLEPNGPLWTNIADESEFERVIRNVQSLSDSDWATIIRPYNEQMMAYQPDNHEFVNLLLSEGVPMRDEVINRA